MIAEQLNSLKWKVKWRLRPYTEPVWRLFGGSDTHWSRVVMDRTTAEHVRGLDPAAKDVLEISGDKWREFGFASYRSVGFPDYDVCARPLDEQFDIIILEQVFEHILYPSRAAKNLWTMLRPGGTLVVTTPFLLCIHDVPIDCSRWTPLGMKYLLAEAGFEPEKMVSGAWGNRACVIANFARWRTWNRYLHSLKNDPKFPIVVWVFAMK
jgi:SAM-dependent methyltransferase